MIPQPILTALLALAGEQPPVPSLAPLVVESPAAAWSLAPTFRDDDDMDEYRRRDGWFARVGFGIGTIRDSDGPDEDIDFDEGYLVPVAVGYTTWADDDNAFAMDWELEGIWSDQDADDDGPIQSVQDISILGVLLNGVADIALNEAFSIYAGAGIGTSFVDVGTESDALNDFDDEDGPFLTWQLKAGLRLWATENISWGLGYRFLNIDDVEIDDDIGNADFDLETEQHAIEMGVGFHF